VSWHDITPKTGATFDFFGHGRTALKVSLNKYLQGAGNGGAFGNLLAPTNLLVTSTTRNWTDANGNFIPDCVLNNPAANGECGAMAAQNFGQSRPGSAYDVDTLRGWGKRQDNWEFTAGVQHELMPRVSADVSFFRRWYGNFIVTDNRAVLATDYTPFALTVPATDSRLPTSGRTISGFYDLNPNRVGQVDNYVTFADNYGRQIEHWNGFDVTVNARPRQGTLLQGGLSTGRTTTDVCEVASQVPEMLFGAAVLTAANNNVWTPLQFCHQDSPFLTQVKLLGAYTLPRIDLQISSAFQSVPGPHILANFNAPNAVVQPSLGRPLSANAANVSVSLAEPGSIYGERTNQLDLRFAKILRLGRTRTSLNFDLYNVFNGNTVQTVNNTFGGATPWQAPQSILLARFAKVSAQVDF
jgi:hypothetical protein